MASASRGGAGAAEEPESEPGDPTSTAPATAVVSYDPREYQPAHPDDRGGRGGKLTKKGAGGKKGAKAKSKEEEEDDGTHCCGNCDAPDAKSKCKGCGVVYYCNRECQTVRARACARIGGRWVASEAAMRRGER